MKQLIFKLGSNVKRSARWFFAGLALGIVAASFIYYGYYNHHYFQIIGLALLIIALPCLIYGYVGILANRVSQIIQGVIDKRERNRRLYQQDEP